MHASVLHITHLVKLLIEDKEWRRGPLGLLQEVPVAHALDAKALEGSKLGLSSHGFRSGLDTVVGSTCGKSWHCEEQRGGNGQ
ncbi:hypothetical protein D7V97_05240 [Corallococcus sp. CA053C]|nr:hypothetical protein D7V97_05240 [Corallococcus sp. CA053C]